MKIYFEDDRLRNPIQLPVCPNYIVDATIGVAACDAMFRYIRENADDAIVYTNSIIGFANEFAWNGTLMVPEIYIRAGEHMLFTRIDELTSRELREGHNLSKMYISGEFSNE